MLRCIYGKQTKNWRDDKRKVNAFIPHNGIEIGNNVSNHYKHSESNRKAKPNKMGMNLDFSSEYKNPNQRK